ncbi:MAG: arylesterase [Gammaproteobacteria bacterium]|jgi:acyl-CoA thioesterase-1|nr:arylesterase [Gammaproteobacteria bacterium]MCW8942642.1 arylesterase [Gammaproteobacteria bacterium]
MIKNYSDYLFSKLAPVLLLLMTGTVVIGSCLMPYPTAVAATKTPATILVLGDSLSGSYGINADEGWVALLQQQLTQHGFNYKVINVSVSGDTTRTGLSRIEPALKTHRPDIVIIALGGNDGLRGLPFSEIENSLARIIELCRSQQAELLLVGVRLPPNYGQAYTEKFAALYQRLADEYQIPLVAKMLDQVADNRELMQQDGMHPKAEAQPQVMKNVWAGLKPVLEEEQR